MDSVRTRITLAVLLVCSMSAADRVSIGSGSPRIERPGASPLAATHQVVVNANGSFTPQVLYIRDGDTVEWALNGRTHAIVPAAAAPAAGVCPTPKPYAPADVTDFTGPLPLAPSGSFTISPVDRGLRVEQGSCSVGQAIVTVGTQHLCRAGVFQATMDTTWQNPNLTGVFIRLLWNQVQIAPGAADANFDFSILDREVQKAVDNGKVFSLGIRAGSDGTPDWIFSTDATGAPRPGGGGGVARLALQDFGDDDNSGCGVKMDLGSPTDLNYQKHYFDVLTKVAGRIKTRADWYRALAYIKPSGANLFTHENRLPKFCTPGCAICNPQVFAQHGYTPSGLYAFYRNQADLLRAQFPRKALSYALIQAGFPKVNETGGWEQSDGSSSNGLPLPSGTEQTERILTNGRIDHGSFFAVQHNGLGPVPPPRTCLNEGVHPVRAPFVPDGAGCPNRWVLQSGIDGFPTTITGWQTSNAQKVGTPGQLDGTFQNALSNSDGSFEEIYEERFWEAINTNQGTLPSGKTIGAWSEEFHSRRRTLFSAVPDPFPTVHRHTFRRSSAPGNQVLYYYDPSSCGGAAKGAYGAVVILTDTASPPVVTVDKTALAFGAATNGTALVSKTSDQIVRLTQTGAGPLWTAVSNQPWLTVSPSSGSGSATLTIGVTFAAGLPVSGTVTGAIALTVTGANPVGPIAVTLQLRPSGTTALPFGLVDTPVDGVTGVTGSIAVTGWALDDTEVRQVRILRDPVAGEGTAQVFIGTAVFVDGARPDVAAVNATVPLNTRAGWGYLLLTNFLPDQGNGTFRLSAYADDADGQSTRLGSKTITCANRTATRPFGAIDTPAQGEVVSGTSYTSFGWVLARDPALAYPPNGTVSLVIDGAFGPSPTGWTSRPDLTTLFPAATYPGITNALGVAAFDTTTLTNGVHTIAWVVTANNGQADGVGSRYFTVANGVSPVTGAVASGLTRQSDEPATDAGLKREATRARDQINAAPLDRTPFGGRRGYDIEAPLRAYSVSSGRATVLGEELDRIELRLGGPDTPDLTVGPGGDHYAGHLRVGDDLWPLPIGSRLDADTGGFTWQPGVGFVHAYDLVFARWRDGHPVARREVRIVLNPKGSNRVGSQVVIDTPRVPGSDEGGLRQPFAIAGWAIDLDSEIGTGVDTVHVWAYSLTGDTPVFLGAASYGGARPDVAAIFGERFSHSGYGMTVESLQPGTYDLAVFAWETAHRRFAPARVVRVTVR